MRLERIVADLVDLARVENRAGTLDVRVFAPARVFERVLRRHEHEALQRSITIRADVAPDADQLSGDPDRLEQVVENLVANALRHVPDGGTIALAAVVSGGTAVLRVADTGTGIAAEHLPHVFDRFYKADPARVAAGERAVWQRVWGCRSSRRSSSATAAASRCRACRAAPSSR